MGVEERGGSRDLGGGRFTRAIGLKVWMATGRPRASEPLRE